MGEIELSKELYIDGTTIRSKASRRNIKWRSSAETFGKMADDKIQEGVADLLKQIDEGMETDRQDTPTHYTPEQAREIAKKVEEKLGGKNKKGMGKVTAVREACDRKEAHDKTVVQHSPALIVRIVRS